MKHFRMVQLVSAVGAAMALGACGSGGQRNAEGTAGAGMAGMNISDDDDGAATAASVGEPDDLGGNSGSEGQNSGGSVISCPCGSTALWVRATVLSSHDDRLAIRVEEPLSPNPELVSGDELDAQFDGRLPCWAGDEVELVPGEMVLAVVHFATSDRPLQVHAAPWEDEILIAEHDGGELRIPADQVDGLWSVPVKECIETFGDLTQLPNVETSGG